MTTPSTLMASEIAEAPAVVARMLGRNAGAFRTLGERLRADTPPVVATCARGSSDHAATYGKYLIETLVGVPVASAAPSVSSLYETAPVARGALMIVISQSGRSPDLISTAAAWRRSGAQVIALVNDETSPLAVEADLMIPLSAGPERSVAATKSCIAALAALGGIAAAWSGDAALGAALDGLPDALERSIAFDWTPAADALAEADRMFVLGRGYSLGVAQEAALKLKETCAIQAEPFSSAEVRHGPQRIVGPGYPILGFATSDAAGADVARVAADLAGLGATALVAGQDGILPAWTGHPAIEPIVALGSFYRMVEALSRALGFDPDTPPNLSKVTRTT